MSDLGIASYAVVIALLSKMEKRGNLPRRDVIDIIDSALSTIEDLPADDESARVARQALEQQMRRWRARNWAHHSRHH